MIECQRIQNPDLFMVKFCPPPEKHTRMICLAKYVLVYVSGSHGGMAERLKAHVLKTCLGHTNVGSNPTPSAEGCMLEYP